MSEVGKLWARWYSFKKHSSALYGSIFFQWCGSRWFSGAFWRELLRRSFRALNSRVQFSWATLIIDLGKRATTTNKIASINYYIWWCTTTLFQSATAFGGSVHDPPFHECWSPEAALVVARNNERYWEKWDSQIGQNVNHYPMPRSAATRCTVLIWH